MSWKKKLTTCTILAGLTFTAMHVINRMVYYISTIDDKLSVKEKLCYDWRFGKIYYTKSGTGSPILLVHDLNPSSSSYEWNQIIEKLSMTNTVYTLDLLGCGSSDKPYLTYTNYLYVQLISDFIKHIIGEKTDVITSGESGTFVMMSCANDDSMIDKVLLINPGDLIELAKIPTKRTKVIQHILNAPVLGTFLYNILMNKRTIEKDFLINGFYDPNTADENMISTYFESAHKHNTHGKYLYASIKSRFTNANIMHSLRHINNSIFIIIGKSNPEYALIADQYQNYIPSIEIISIDKTKRFPHIEKPDDFLEQVEILFDINNKE